MSIIVKPALFIGLGGSGAMVLRRLKYSLAKKFQQGERVSADDIPPCFAFLEVDADPKSKYAATDLNELDFSDTEFLQIKFAESFGELDNNIRDCKAVPRYAQLAKDTWWWPEGFAKKLQDFYLGGAYRGTGNQAYQVRQVGRWMLWQDIDRFTEAVRSLSTQIRGVGENGAVTVCRRKFGVELFDDGGKRDVFLVASVAGGTGCGMLLDALALIKKSHGDIGYNGSALYAFLWTPSCYYKESLPAGAQRKAMDITAHAVFKELNGLCSQKEYPGKKKALPGNVHDVDFNMQGGIYPCVITNELESGNTFNGDIALIARKTSEYIERFVLDLGAQLDQGAGIHSFLYDITEAPRANRSLSQNLSSFGVHRWSYPHEELKRYAGLFTAQWLGRLLQEDSENRDREAIRNLWHTFIDGSASDGKGPWVSDLPQYGHDAHAYAVLSVNAFKRTPKNEIVEKILSTYALHKSNLQNEYNNKAGDFTIARSKVRQNLRSLMANGNARLSDAIAYLDALKMDLGARETMRTEQYNEESRAVSKFLPDSKLKDKYKWVGKWNNWFDLLGDVSPLVTLLDGYLKTLRRMHQAKFDAEAAAAFGLQISAMAAELRGLEENVKTTWSSQEMEANKLWTITADETGTVESKNPTDGTHPETLAQKTFADKKMTLSDMAGTGEWFGCQPDDRVEYDAVLKKFAEENVASIRTAIFEGNNTFPSPSQVAAHINEKVDAALRANRFHDPTYLEAFKDYVDRKRRKTPGLPKGYAEVFRADVIIPATPAITPTKGGFLHHFIFAPFEQNNFFDGRLPLNAAHEKFKQVDNIGRHTVVCVALRVKMTAANIKELELSNVLYKSEKGIPRPIEFPNVSAHLMEGAERWDGLFGDDGLGWKEINVEQYIALCKDLGMLVRSKGVKPEKKGTKKTEALTGKKKVQKDNDGGWWYLSYKGTPPSPAKHDEQWQGMKNVRLAFADVKFRVQIEKIQVSLVDRIVKKYSQNPDRYSHWAFAIERPVPTEIHNKVITNRGFTHIPKIDE